MVLPPLPAPDPMVGRTMSVAVAPGLRIDAVVIRVARAALGRHDALVRPVAGTGEMWVPLPVR